MIQMLMRFFIWDASVPMEKDSLKNYMACFIHYKENIELHLNSIMRKIEVARSYSNASL